MGGTRKKILRRAAQLAVLCAVSIGIYWSIRRSTDELGRQQQDLLSHAAALRQEAESDASPTRSHELLAEAQLVEESASRFWQADLSLLGLAGLLYAAGMLPACLYWHRCLHRLGQTPNFSDTAWAYFWGNLGKYFPGKAMVLVLRVAALSQHAVHKTATTITIFMETLTMMAVGGAIAAICTTLLNIDWRLTGLSLGLLLVTFVPTFPPILRRLIPRLQRGVSKTELDRWTGQVSWRQTAMGWLLLTITWMLFGLSLLAVLQSLPITAMAEVTGTTLVLSATGACALAVVLGFVSLIPGGAGVREAVLSIVLSPVVGPTAALCGALWMRVVWLATELIVVGALAVWRATVNKPTVLD